MRIFCSICKELFIPYSEINATVCGHLYHGSCITRWLKQHKTCPQCRANLTSPPIRVYFDVDKDNELDASTLEVQLENVNTELRQIQVDNKILREKNEKIEKTLQEIEHSSSVIRDKNQTLKSSIKALKNQIIKLKEENEKGELVKKDLEDLKIKMRAYECVDHIINCSSEEANKLLRITPITEFGLKQLSIYTSALKDKTEKDKKKISELVSEKKNLEGELAAEKLKNSKSSRGGDYLKLKKAYDNLQTELGFAKEVIKQLSQKVTKEEDDDNIMQCHSQVPKKRPLFAINVDTLENTDANVKKLEVGGDVSGSIKHWEDIVAAGPSQQHRTSFKHIKSTSISSEISSTKKQNYNLQSNYTFDGMGGSKKICLGHATPQDEFLKIKTNSKPNERPKIAKKSIELIKSRSIFAYIGSSEEKK